MELITKLSGLLKAITHTIRVVCRLLLKFYIVISPGADQNISPGVGKKLTSFYAT